MHRSAKLALTALAATLALAFAVGAAVAGRLNMSNEEIRATWTTLRARASNELATIRCPVTLEGSFHSRTIVKVARTLIGHITRAIVKQESCANGKIIAFNGTEPYNGGTSPNSLPWHITYESFFGMLPAISRIRLLLREFRFGIEVPPICTAQVGAGADNVSIDAARANTAAISSLTPVSGNSETVIRRDRDPVLGCPATFELAESSNPVVLLNTDIVISIILI